MDIFLNCKIVSTSNTELNGLFDSRAFRWHPEIL